MKRQTIKAVILCFSVIALFSLANCGYEIVREKGIYGGDVTSISIPVFKNQSYEPHLSMFVTDAFSKELLSMGLFKINREGGDAYLQGIIKNVRVIPYNIGKGGYVTEKRIDMTVEISLFRNNGSLIKRWTLIEYETYRVGGSVTVVPRPYPGTTTTPLPYDTDIQYYNYDEPSKQDAIRKIAERLAKRLASYLIMEH